MSDTFPLFEPGCYYHVYNRGNNRERLFYGEDNYLYFLKKYDSFLSDFTDLFAYCLLTNHFHVLIRIKTEKEILENAARLKIPSFEKMESLGSLQAGRIVSDQFRRLFIAYSMAINKQHSRTGSLFQKKFKRKKVDTDQYFTQLIFYIHNNPVHHQIHVPLQDYKWSSYQRFLLDKPSKLSKKEVLEWFGGKKEFVEFHQRDWNPETIKDLWLED
jgi:REP element-mobilizing transposase RayT